jgi:hypothetical protein
MTPEQLKKLEPSARAFAESVLEEGVGFAGIRFENATVFFIHDAVPGASKIKEAITAVVGVNPDSTKIGEI